VSEAGRVDGPDPDASSREALARVAAPETGGQREGAAPDLAEFLVCELDGSAYAIAIERVREIVRMRPLTPLPRTPEWMLGVISLRGEIVQVVDLRMCLGVDRAEIGRATRIVVLHGDDRISGVLVDGVRRVLRIPAQEIRPATSAGLHAVSEVCRDGDGFVSILDLDRVWDDHAGS